MKNYIQPGKVLTAIAGAGGVTSGSFQVIGLIFGVAATSAAQGKEYEIATGEVFEFAKATGTAWGFGDAIYWDATAKVMTKTASGNTKVGVAAQSALDTAGLGVVRLNDNF